VITVYHCTCQYMTLERDVDLSPDRSLLLAYSPPMSSLQRLCTRESRDPRHHGLSVSNGKARTLGMTKFFELLNALVASLQRRKTLHQSSDLATLLQQFAFHSLMIFHVFSQFLDHVALFHGALACCNIVTYLLGVQLCFRRFPIDFPIDLAVSGGRNK